MKIQFAQLPNNLPWVIGPNGELVINSATINDFEETYMAVLENYYAEDVLV